MLTGGCYCGHLRYAIDADPKLVANCHCTICRRTSGAPYVSWIIIAADAFRWTAGKPALLQSSSHGQRHFCAQCGTPIAFSSSQRATDLDITIGSLDQPEPWIPTLAVHAESRLPWVHDPLVEASA